MKLKMFRNIIPYIILYLWVIEDMPYKIFHLTAIFNLEVLSLTRLMPRIKFLNKGFFNYLKTF